MSNPIIEIQGVGKRYRIGATKEPYLSLRDEVAKWFSPAARRARAAEEEFWALRDVTFSVEPGEAIGIIGRNGAGKSTLLKILSQITPPTEGKITMRGRVGSLLEVGTGFHPELTGRENIYMNGAILGMSRREIARKFDEIVAFAEMEKFLDTPAKRYSSGMYVRLAFAVAAHLEPEILVVDEVLAVGDAQFQKKCLGKMGEVAKQGRTVLFVSHNLGAIAALCGRGLLLQSGRLCADDRASEVIGCYQAACASSYPDPADLATAERKGNGKACFVSLSMQAFSPEGRKTDTLVSGADLEIVTTVAAFQSIIETYVGIIIYDLTGYRLIDVNTALCDRFLTLDRGQTAEVRFRLKQLLLRPGTYLLGLYLGRSGIETNDWIETAARINVEVDASQAKHSQTFPGVYQCSFTHEIVIKGCAKTDASDFQVGE